MAVVSRTVARLLGLAVVLLLGLYALTAQAAGWYDAETCPAYVGMVQQIELLPQPDRDRLADHLPTGPGHQTMRVLALAALNYVAEGGTSAAVAADCVELEKASAL